MHLKNYIYGDIIFKFSKYFKDDIYDDIILKHIIRQHKVLSNCIAMYLQASKPKINSITSRREQAR